MTVRSEAEPMGDSRGTSTGESSGQVPSPPQQNVPVVVSDEYLSAYAATARSSAQASLSNLDASINWSLTLTLAIAGYVLSAVVKANGLQSNEVAALLAIVATGIVMNSHFGVRSAKSYLNIVRFAKLEREAIKCSLQLPGANVETFPGTVNTYHVEWKSPLGGKVILKKVLFELGYFYLVLFMAAMYVFVAQDLPGRAWRVHILTLGIPLAFIAWEIRIFRRSPYLRDAQIDGDTESKA